MKISIITPLYDGKKYLPRLLKMIESNHPSANTEIEYIIVNDFPQEKITLPTNIKTSFCIKIINHTKNMGIHRTRVDGLEAATGKYILFLDQDDTIAPNALQSQLSHCKQNTDLIIGNGYYELNGKLNKIYGNIWSQKFTTKERPYINIRNFIFSPGQCLIRRSSIPKQWKRNIMNENGADDYYLWLLLFNSSKHRVTFNPNLIYTHKHTGKNLSEDKLQIYNSNLNMIEMLSKDHSYSRKKIRNLSYIIDLKQRPDHNHLTIIDLIKHPIIIAYNLYYKLLWKGYKQR